ncbi:hypothetical protein PACTADRAFT_44199 [Pachysolen tannophilus NRRL Y-2460]|uniref:Phosphoglycerate mutase n=1 Tax=Pachysolen tannophilus NRRL Y-2460 TaxID=669874 RepID=A0A1E4TSK8_PACTA|nr:hypothetical protein PACTADRAFT_44199 [Pachysolen tannophilus NRRL Y-2460]
MSLIKPITVDYIDAHDGEANDAQFKKHLLDLSSEKNADGKYIRPWKFEVVQGFFQQSDPSLVDELEFNYIENDFGKIPKTWSDLKLKISELNANAKENECYKILFLARHGQGYHNFGVTKYGSKDWDDHWSKIEGDGEIIWGPDPFLTELGINQAKENNRAWKEQISKGAPIPSAFYSSPFTRSASTLVNTWLDIALTESPIKAHPLIKEDIRETIGVHLCDKRSPRRVIEERFAKYGFIFEDNFEEEDVLYKSNWRESVLEQGVRLNKFLQFLFEKEWDADLAKTKTEQDVFVNVTSHAGTTRSLLLVLGHPRFTIAAGGMIPVAVKATRQLD